MRPLRVWVPTAHQGLVAAARRQGFTQTDSAAAQTLWRPVAAQ